MLLTGDVIDRIYLNKIKLQSQRTLIWSRHPFDKKMVNSLLKKQRLFYKSFDEKINLQSFNA